MIKKCFNYLFTLVEKIYRSNELFISATLSTFMVGLIFVNVTELFGLKPCILCKIERYILMGIIATGLIINTLSGLIETENLRQKFGKVSIRVFLGVVFIICVIGLYHFAVERRWIPMPMFCKPQALDVTDIIALSVLMEYMPPQPLCNQPQIVFSNFSVVDILLIGMITSLIWCIGLIVFRIKKGLSI